MNDAVSSLIHSIFDFYFGFVPVDTLYRFSVSKEDSNVKLNDLQGRLIEFYEADMTKPIRERILKMSYRNILYTGRFYFKRGITILRKLAKYIGYNLVVRSMGKDRRMFIFEKEMNPVILRPMTPPIPFQIIHLDEPRLISFKM